MVAGYLAAMERLDAGRGEPQGIEGLGRAGGDGSPYLIRGHPQGRGGEVLAEPVEAAGVIHQGGVAPGDHTGDDPANGLVHILGDLALDAEKTGEGGGEIGVAAVEAHHQAESFTTLSLSEGAVPASPWIAARPACAAS